MIYRPLPGEKPETVNYTVTITDRRTKNVLAQNTFEMTILAQEKTTPEEPVEEPTEEPIENPKTGTENAVLPCLFMGAAALAAVLLTGGQKRFGNR